MNNIAILIIDLSGYTTEKISSLVSLREKYIRLVYQSLTGKSYILNKDTDQLFIVSTSADDIAKTLMELYKKVAQEKNLLPVCAGIHYGEVMMQGALFFGATINVAARIAARAKHGIILASGDFMHTLSCRETFHYIHHDQLRFKNGSGAVDIVALLPEYNIISVPDFAGGCTVQGIKEVAGFKDNYAGKVYYFYSRVIGKLTMQHLLNFSRSSVQFVA